MRKIREIKMGIKHFKKTAVVTVAALTLTSAVTPALINTPLAPMTVHAADPNTAGVINVNYVTPSGQVLYSTVVKGVIGSSATIVAKARVLGYLPDIASHGDVVGGDQNDYFWTHTDSNGDSTILFDGEFGPQPKTVNFYYYENMATNTINIVDATTGKALATEKVTGQEGTSSSADYKKIIAKYEAKGYKLNSSDYKPVYGYYGATYTVNLVHKIDKSEEQRMVYRNIKWLSEDGTVLDFIGQNTRFNGTKTFDNVTKKATYSDWDKASDTFPAIPERTFSGYTIKGSQPILALTVTPNSPQFTNVEILYTPKKDSREVVNVYRLYNKVSMQHLYTADQTEYKTLPKLSKDWVQEGVNFKEYKNADATTTPIYRIYTPKSGEHLLTSDSNEVKVLSANGWKKEGTAFHTLKTGGNEIHRLFNPKAGIGAHMVTGDTNEKKSTNQTSK